MNNGSLTTSTSGIATDQFVNQLGANLSKNIVNNLTGTLINSTITGKPLNEQSLQTALTSAIITAGIAQGANDIGGAKQAGDINTFTQAVAHAVLGCAGGAAAAGNSSGCGAGAIGGVVGELTAKFADSNDMSPDSAVVLAKVMSATAGLLVSGGDATQVNVAATMGMNAAENNWLATRQKALMAAELNAAGTVLEKAEVLRKYAVIGARQKWLTGVGVGKGLAESGWSDVKGMAEFLSDPVKGLAGIKALVTDPQTRAALGDQVANDFTAKIDRMNTALTVGGDANAEQFGRDLGSLVWQVGSVVTGVAGAAKAGTMLASTGVKVGAEVLENTALKLSTFNAGSVQSFKSAEAVNALMNSADGWSPAWKPGTAVAEMTMKPGTTVKMVVDEATYQALQDGKTERAFGGWATFDDVPNQAYARDQLAITSAMKPDVGYVVELKITQPINAKVGVVGAQGGATGGGNQLHFVVNPADRNKIFELVPNSGKALK